MSEYNTVMSRNLVLATSMLVMILCVGIIIVPMAYWHGQPTYSRPRAIFVFSSWPPLDENGQGFEGFVLYENSSGSWSEKYVITRSDPDTVEWDPGVGIKIHSFSWMNELLYDVEDWRDCKLYIRHYIEVTDDLGTTVFSKQNFTYYGGDPDNWPYILLEHYVILGFLPAEGRQYTITITCECYYEE